VVRLSFSNNIRTYTWVANKTDGSFATNNGLPCGGHNGGVCGTKGGEIEVHRGPLTFALRPNASVTENTVGCIGGRPDGRYGWNCTVVDNSTGALIPPQFPMIKSRNLMVTKEGNSGGNWSYAILVDSLAFGGFKPYPPSTAEGEPTIPFRADYKSDALATVTVKARNLNYAKGGMVSSSFPFAFHLQMLHSESRSEPPPHCIRAGLEGPQPPSTLATRWPCRRSSRDSDSSAVWRHQHQDICFPSAQ
jgi:hypothetical protein